MHTAAVGQVLKIRKDISRIVR